MLTPIERAAVERRAEREGDGLADSVRSYLLYKLDREIAQERERCKRAGARKKKRPEAVPV